MLWSAHFHLVALLDMYIGPTPVVTELVRKQLLRDEETEAIRMAIEKKAKGQDNARDLYSSWLTYSGLDFNNKSAALISLVNEAVLQRAMFDLVRN